MDLSRRELLSGCVAAGVWTVGRARGEGGGSGRTGGPPGNSDENCRKTDEVGHREIRVDLSILDGSGAPVADEPVVLEDRGGTPDGRLARTDSDGAVTFIEGVGPPPCNRQTVVLPWRDRRIDLGCNNGGTTIERTIEVDPASGGPETGESPPVVDSSAGPERTLRVELAVRSTSGDPVPDEPVILQDRGGTPDTRVGWTGPEGRIVFLENVGPSPCNWQTLVLPRRERRIDLGCNGGGASVERRVTVEAIEDEQNCDADSGGAPSDRKKEKERREEKKEKKEKKRRKEKKEKKEKDEEDDRDDKGHGNDEDGVDEDNPGESKDEKSRDRESKGAGHGGGKKSGGGPAGVLDEALDDSLFGIIRSTLGF